MAEPSAAQYQSLIETLKQFKTTKALFASQYYAEQGAFLHATIDKIWHKELPVLPRLKDFLRIAHWNIERGHNLEAIVETFRNHTILHAADIISLNEVDIGMLRTHNTNIAFELAQKLGMHVAYVSEYLELTKGIGAEAKRLGDNNESLHGNAILSRYPIQSLHMLRLPSCFDSFAFTEQRFGDRVALIAEIAYHQKPFWLVSTHLEVRHTPECRAKQLIAIFNKLSELAPTNAPVLIAGDFNTGTFKRGHIGYALWALCRLLISNPTKMQHILCHPEDSEPLFSIATKAGWDFRSFNDHQATCTTHLDNLDEASYFPTFIKRIIDKRLAAYNRQLDFRLDFFLARNLLPLSKDASQDSYTNIKSVDPQTIPGLITHNGAPISDHHPIVCDISFH